MSSVVIQTSFLGDVVLTTPLLAELARRGPVDVVTTPAAAPLLANHPAVRDTIVYDKRKGDRGAAGVLRLAARLRRARYDAAFLAQGSVRSAALAMLAGIGRRVGFSSSAGRPLYTERVRYRDDVHHAERLWRLAAGDAAPSPDESVLRPCLQPGDAERRAVDALLAGSDHPKAPLVVLAPGSVWATKAWPYFAELAALLARSGMGRVVVIGSGAEREAGAAIAAAVTEVPGALSALDATGRLPLLASAELVARAVVAVVNDSLPQHLASAMGTPTVAIFGPTVPEFGFGPLAPRRAVMGLDGLACRPCDRHGPMRCPLGHWRCMREIAATRVAEAVRELMTTPSHEP